MKLIPATTYEEYRVAQRRKFRRKRHRKWINEREWQWLADTIRELTPEVTGGICHGVRLGIECKRFTELLGVKVIGTEIGSVTNELVVGDWDFHKTKPEWEQAFSFVYSNSLDHSYNPALALEVWASQLKSGGAMLIHWSDDNLDPSDVADCFGATAEECAKMLAGQCTEVRQISSPVTRKHRTLIVGKRV